MSQIARTDDQRVVAIENRINHQVSSAISVGTGGISFQNAGEVMEYAKMMAVSGSAVPKHLRGQPGACLGIIDDAIRFQTSPYALARKSYFVNDNLAYEAQVLAGIVNAHAPLKQRPQIVYEGEGIDRVCIVTGEFRDGAVREYRSPAIGKITPKNSPLWKNDPDQQLAYYSLRGFARRHCPEILLGIYDVEEMRSIDHRDDEPRPSLADRLSAARQEPAQEREGFDPDFVTRETDGLTSGPEIDNEQHSSADPSSADDDGSGGDQTDAAPDPSASEGDDAGEPVVEAPDGPDAAGSPVDNPRNTPANCLDAFLRTAATTEMPVAERRDLLEKMKDYWKEALPDRHDFVKEVLQVADKVAKGEQQELAARKYLEAML